MREHCTRCSVHVRMQHCAHTLSVLHPATHPNLLSYCTQDTRHMVSLSRNIIIPTVSSQADCANEHKGTCHTIRMFLPMSPASRHTCPFTHLVATMVLLLGRQKAHHCTCPGSQSEQPMSRLVVASSLYMQNTNRRKANSKLCHHSRLRLVVKC